MVESRDGWSPAVTPNVATGCFQSRVTEISQAECCVGCLEPGHGVVSELRVKVD